MCQPADRNVTEQIHHGTQVLRWIFAAAETGRDGRLCQAWVEDETNADLRNPRNLIRHLGLPELDGAYGGPTRA